MEAVSQLTLTNKQEVSQDGDLTIQPAADISSDTI